MAYPHEEPLEKGPLMKIGRPRKNAALGSRVSLGLKVTSATKRKLEAAADESGRTQSQEAEFRIEQSFRDDLIVDRVLRAARTA